MKAPTWDVSEEEQLARYLAQQVCDRAAGLQETECVQNAPRDRYFIGNLRPVPLQDDTGRTQYLRDLVDKLAPVAFGAEFRVLPDNEEIVVRVNVAWNCYYRVFPTYEQQCAHQLQRANLLASETTTPVTIASDANPDATDSIDDTDNDAALDDISESLDFQDDLAVTPAAPATSTRQRRQTAPRDSLFLRYKRIDCTTHGIVTLIYEAGSNLWQLDTSDLQTALDAETQRAQQVVLADPEHIRTSSAADEKIRVSEDVLMSETAFRSFCANLKSDVIPQWQWVAAVEVRSTGASSARQDVITFLTFTNISPMLDNAPNTEAFFFAPHATFAFGLSTMLPFELELVPRSFRYDRELWGRGFNCAVVRTGMPNVFETTNTPIHTQLRYSTRTTPQAPFAHLAQDPLPVLEAILASMQADLTTWNDQEQAYQQNFSGWTGVYATEYANDRQKYVEEIERYARGVELIRTNTDVRLAFQLTNETFRRGPKTSWRLFQIVFLVTQIAGIAALADPNSNDAAERSVVDIIYFPTGGGKTEAYLGVIVFHCFFDRLRGKAAGVTAWTRFPLRLLTLQQTQRVADVIGVAELIRREQTDTRLSGSGVAGFAVGYLAGQEATPNELTAPRTGQLPEPNWSKALDARARQQWKKVITCPACRTNTIQVEFDENRARILHKCINIECAFPNGLIPVWVVDNDIYRHLPAVIVGTIDKLAGLGNQRKFALIFGQVDGRCPKHGYYKGVCCQKNCQERLQPSVPVGISGPTLFVQDELHLLKEGLGTFDAHYETFSQELLTLAGQTLPLKIIASSATIEAFERQVEHLYGRTKQEARIFPGLGPTLQRSFYAETLNYPQRLFVGIIPHNKTIFNAVLELVQYYHESVQTLQRLSSSVANPYGGTLTPGSVGWLSLIDYYSTSLNYFTSNRDLNSLRTDLESAVNPDMQQANFDPLELAELTGGTSSDNVSMILERLQTSRPLPGSAPTTVLATNMVSHGVDVDRFNAMIFYGMPTQNAEYIQASSRVGRSHIGIVFNCLKPARERDQSHYAYFSKYHEFLGQLVEPVAINRWSKLSIQYTLPGLFMGILLQRLANAPGVTRPGDYYMLDFVKREYGAGRIKADDFIPFLEAAYRVLGIVGVGPDLFRTEIQRCIPIFLDQIAYASSSQSFVSNALKPFEPMRSLREVDEQIEIELDEAGTRWGQAQS